MLASTIEEYIPFLSRRASLASKSKELQSPLQNELDAITQIVQFITERKKASTEVQDLLMKSGFFRELVQVFLKWAPMVLICLFTSTFMSGHFLLAAVLSSFPFLAESLSFYPSAKHARMSGVVTQVIFSISKFWLLGSASAKISSTSPKSRIHLSILNRVHHLVPSLLTARSGHKAT
jgi:hypothetical protein